MREGGRREGEGVKNSEKMWECLGRCKKRVEWWKSGVKGEWSGGRVV